MPMDWQPGDIAACYGRDLVSRTISWGCASLIAPRGLRLGPSHVAMICHQHGRPLWVESTTLSPRPCLVRGEPVAGVQVHDPMDRVADYLCAGGRVDIYRLVDFWRFTPEESDALTYWLVDYCVDRGISYDMSGAILSGRRLTVRLLPWLGADLHTLFCSELVAAVLARMNRINHSNAARFHPARLLRRVVSTGHYERVRTFDQTLGICHAA